MPNGIFLIRWDEVEGGLIYLKYPEDLEIPNPVVQQITISHNFTESYIITEEKNWNSVSYYNENKEMIIVLGLSKYDDGNDYLEILEKFNQEIDKVTEEKKLKEHLETMFHISLDAFRTTDEVITKLSNEVAYLKTREYDFEVKFDLITKSNHLSVKSKILFLLAINDSLTLQDIENSIKTSKRWLSNVLETLIKNEVVGYNSNKDIYYLNV
jgi:DNA-binding transcriptional regulator GbsR (MarR family)